MSDTGGSADQVTESLEDHGETTIEKIELVWPGKDVASLPSQDSGGRWHLEPQPAARRLHPLIDLQSHGDGSALSGLVVSGDRLTALATLRRRYPRAVAFAYLDIPRIEIDDKSSAFQGDPTYVYSTWLSVLREHLRGVLPLMSRAGVVAILSGDTEEPYARLLLSETLGRDNYIGTVVWQRSYGPRNMRGMKEFSATHDCIVLFAVDKAALPAVGLRRSAEEAGFANPDGDPRGPWKAAHKGARTRRAKSDFNTYVPPYRWGIAAGRLPEGLWRLNPLTGVIWGRPTEVGDFRLMVEVRDRTGATATKELVLHCSDTVTPPGLASPPWVFEEVSTSGPLRIASDQMPKAAVGYEYSAILLAEGGEPYTGPPKRPGSGRYWEFADDTLRKAYALDKVDLGTDGNVIPRIKTYPEDVGEEVISNQQTWWPAKSPDGSPFAGFTQDATKHLKRLRELGLIHEALTTAKPEHLIARLLSVFSRPGQLTVEVFGTTGDLAAVALKMGRGFLYLSGSSDRDRTLLEDCALRRLMAVVDGKDNELQDGAGEIRMSTDAYMPFPGGGGFAWCRIGDWLFEQGPREEFPHMNRAFDNAATLGSAILTSQGFLPDSANPFQGSGPEGSRALVIPPDESLTAERAAMLVGQSEATRLTVFYFMASDEFDPSVAPPTTTYRRVPVEIALY